MFIHYYFLKRYTWLCPHAQTCFENKKGKMMQSSLHKVKASLHELTIFVYITFTVTSHKNLSTIFIKQTEHKNCKSQRLCKSEHMLHEYWRKKLVAGKKSTLRSTNIFENIWNKRFNQENGKFISHESQYDQNLCKENSSSELPSNTEYSLIMWNMYDIGFYYTLQYLLACLK